MVVSLGRKPGSMRPTATPMLSWPPRAVSSLLEGDRIDNPKPGARLILALLPIALHDERLYFISERRKASGI
jgi:hypothetical protein